MITPDMVLEWRKHTLDELAAADGLASLAIKPYHVATCTQDDPDLLALSQLEHIMAADGFGPLYLDQGHFHCTYGALPLRVFVCHSCPGKFIFTVCVHRDDQVRAVAEYRNDHKVLHPALTKTYFNVAGMVLPQ